MRLASRCAIGFFLDKNSKVYTLYISFLCECAMTDKPAKVKPNKKDGQLLIRISIPEREQFLGRCHVN